MKKYYAQEGEQDDLISIGTIGLIKGISSYKPEKGTRLATYAARCIENAIHTLVRQMMESARSFPMKHRRSGRGAQNGPRFTMLGEACGS